MERIIGVDNERNGQALLFFHVVEQAFNEAVKKMGVIERNFNIAGRCGRLLFAGPELIPQLWPALQHLQDVGEKPVEFTIHIWDSHSTGVSLPQPPWGPGDFIAKGEIQGYSAYPLLASYQPADRILSLVHMERGLAFYWLPDAEKIPYYESGAPFRTILHWWTRRLGMHLVHAAAVGYPDGGVLLAGKGGSGKSSTALACLNGNFLYTGDDYVTVGLNPAYVYSLYNTAKLNADNVQRFPSLAPFIVNQEHLSTEKALLFTADHMPTKICREFPIRAILIPRITHGEKTFMEKVSPLQGLSALAPTTIFQLPGAGEDTLRFVGDLVQQVPTYRLNLGENPEEINSAIERFLKTEYGKGIESVGNEVYL